MTTKYPPKSQAPLLTPAKRPPGLSALGVMSPTTFHLPMNTPRRAWSAVRGPSARAVESAAIEVAVAATSILTSAKSLMRRSYLRRRPLGTRRRRASFSNMDDTNRILGRLSHPRVKPTDLPRSADFRGWLKTAIETCRFQGLSFDV